ncbi:ABC transporter permease [Vineibacter terrae]|uniref:ABC transporter permease n=1 Tax=Vineibacter terrae TaxID=2586908 RepID=A0A5C8PRX3_9HYPH|nr:ABC transporter permease [Vineibacter terrae]TXL78726.1 ABC transporter permease [Vineibacter terrae]
MSRRPDWLCALALVLLLAALVLPVGRDEAGAAYWSGQGPVIIGLAAACVLAGWAALTRPQGLAAGLTLAVAVVLGAAGPLALLGAGLTLETEAPGLWLVVVALVCLTWRALQLLAGTAPNRLVHDVLVPALFGLWLLYLWEVVVGGFAIPRVLLPGPSQIGRVIAASADVLAQDFRQTFLKSVLTGFALGSGSGFLVAILIDRSPFLQRGLLPLGALVSAIPIVGIAPIMVMWFGFDWQSKVAVIVVMTFFPMLVNALAGLHAAGDMERDLMRSYAASYWQTLLRLRLPNALPFIFNALKINSTLSLIGAIVAEFFGTPILGMGFRISTEVGRMNIEMVWATIAVAAVAGSLFYAVLALGERALTFWHPSYRQ